MEGDFRLGEYLVQPSCDRIESSISTVQLEPKVMDVLVHLARYSNQVVSKNQLIDSVWPNVFVTDEVLTNSIYKLRLALGDNPKKPGFIETVPRRGYKLIAPVSAPQEKEDRYRILGKIGEGGVAEVFLAEDRLLRRRVALKEVKLGMDTRQILARFELEQNSLALMNHPYIARLYDSGITKEGRVFFVMEHVAGVTITDYCDREKLSVKERLTLFIKVCNAVDHAHRKGIIHRDLKPSNILVAVQDREAIPKLIDFGLAKALGPRAAELTLFTPIGQMLMGSLKYMSPEQMSMSREIDASTDIYSLGILLYELLTGSTPFGSERERAALQGNLARVVEDEFVVNPSTWLRQLTRDRSISPEEDGGSSNAALLANVARNRSAEPQKLIELIRGDLDWIAVRATEKDRRRRYQTVVDIEEDIRLHLRHRPITACPPDLFYRLGKFVRRHRSVVTVGVGLLGGMLLTLSSLVYSRFEIDRERDVARDARQQALENERSGRRLAYRASLLAAQAALEQNDADLASRHLRQAPAELRGWEWTHLSSRTQRSRLRLTGLATPPRSLAFSSSGNILVSIGSCEAIRLWDLELGELKSEKPIWSGCRQPSAYIVDGQQVLLVGYDADTGSSVVRTLNASSLEEMGRLSIPGYIEVNPIRRLAYSLDLSGSKRADRLERGELSVRDLRNGKIIASRSLASKAGRLFDSDRLMRVSPDGSKLMLWKGLEATVFEGQSLKTISRIELCSGCPDRGIPNRNILDGAFTPDNHRVVLISADAKLRIFNSADGKPIFEVDSGAGLQLAVAVSSTDPLFATGGQDHAVRLWRLEDGRLIGILRGHRGAVNSLAFSADGTHLVSSGLDREIRLWEVPPRENPILLNAHKEHARAVAWSRDGTRMYSGGWDGIAASPEAVRIWTAEGRLSASVGADDWIVYSMAVSPDAAQLAVGVSRWNGTRPVDHRIRILNAWTGQPETELGPFEFLRTSLAFHPRGDFILTGGAQLEVWHLPTRTRVHSFGDIDALGGQAAYSPDGRLIAAGTLDSAVKVWNADTFELLHRLDGHQGTILSLTFSPDNSQLITAAEDNTIRSWRLESGSEVGQLRIDSGAATYSMAYSPDGLRLITGGKDGAIRVWDSQRLAELVSLRGHSGAIVGLAWSPDGIRFASASSDGSVGIWN